jgi:hypothetical protein
LDLSWVLLLLVPDFDFDPEVTFFFDFFGYSSVSIRPEEAPGGGETHLTILVNSFIIIILTTPTSLPLPFLYEIIIVIIFLFSSAFLGIINLSRIDVSRSFYWFSSSS